MKKLIAIILLSVMAITLCACEDLTEVSREPVDVRYTPPYEGVETKHDYVYDWWRGDFVLVPVVQTVHHQAKWEIQYKVTYSNGEERTVWDSCTESEYNSTKDKLYWGADDGKVD